MYSYVQISAKTLIMSDYPENGFDRGFQDYVHFHKHNEGERIASPACPTY